MIPTMLSATPETSPPSRRRGLKSPYLWYRHDQPGSPPSRRRGLKYFSQLLKLCFVKVASLAEAWIEMNSRVKVLSCRRWSPPSRRRGLKYHFGNLDCHLTIVASLAEAWIEICVIERINPPREVASLAEAWIEIARVTSASRNSTSPPSRRRGLK